MGGNGGGGSFEREKECVGRIWLSFEVAFEVCLFSVYYIVLFSSVQKKILYCFLILI